MSEIISDYFAGYANRLEWWIGQVVVGGVLTFLYLLMQGPMNATLATVLISVLAVLSILMLVVDYRRNRSLFFPKFLPIIFFALTVVGLVLEYFMLTKGQSFFHTFSGSWSRTITDNWQLSLILFPAIPLFLRSVVYGIYLPD